jgi:hypothetical protein
MATYPNNILIKADVVDEVDDVVQEDHNILKGEIIALQTFVGTNPEADRGSLADRLAPIISGSGGFYLTNADYDGAATYPGLYWYRTDTDTLKNVKYDGTIQSIGGSFTNTVFNFSLSAGSSANHGDGIVSSTDQTDNTTAANLYYWRVNSSAFKTMIESKFQMFAGINTITPIVRIWQDQTDSAVKTTTLRVTVGNQNVSGVCTGSQTTPEWVTLSGIDVSGFDVGTVYDVVIDQRHSSSGNGFLDHVLGIGS